MDRTELATVLRTARARVDPVDVGLPLRRRRQVPGLRREEVARLAGVSVEYIVRLEQARGPKPSEQVLAALSRALRLNDDDRDLLYRLAGAEPPQAGLVPMVVRAGVRRLLERMGDTPAVVLSAKSDVLAWNRLAVALLGDFADLPAPSRNIIRRRFLSEGPISTAVRPDEDAASAGHCVGCLRTAQARYPNDPELAGLIADLRGGSPAFEELWLDGRSSSRRPRTAAFAHPRFGEFELDCDVLLVPEADQSVMVYSAEPGTPGSEALGRIRAGVGVG